MVDGLIKLMNSPGDFTGPVNLGNPDEVSILKLAERIIQLTGSRSKISFKPLPADDPKHRQPVITLAKEKLGWTPRIPLEEGLSKTIAYFDELLKRG
jgi:UDP-glucuronate decarboxylase